MPELPTQSRKRRIVIVEYDVTYLAPRDVDALLLGAFKHCPNVTLKIVTTSVRE